MQQLITTYLLQNKECVLPGIGTISIEYIPASFDNGSKQILPPGNEIFFSETYNLKPDGLIKFIADKKHTTINEAENILNDFLKAWKEKINDGESLELKTIGSLKKNNDGRIFLEKDNSYQFLKPIDVKEIYQADNKISEEKNLFTADTVTYEERYKANRSYWSIWAAVLAAIAIGLIVFYFSNNKTNGVEVGDKNNITIDSSAGTYSLPGK